jgi:pyruvate dehydrogenase E1 component beta subunit
MTYGSAIREGLKEEMRRDPSVFLIGEEIGAYGGCLKVTVGLLDEFGPGRVVDTPISETTIIGLSMGAAIMGMKPVAEMMYMDFLQIAGEQLVTQAARARFLSGGKLAVPMVLRTQYSLGRGAGPQHSQFFPSWFTQSPGLKIVLPSTPADAKGLLKASIRDGNPVLFIEAGELYTTEGDVPAEDYVINLGQADIKRPGKDITLVAISRMVPEALKAAVELNSRGIEAEVIDPRTVQPLDTSTIVNSVKKTRRILIAADDFVIGGIGAAIISAVLDEVFYYMDTPPRILGPPFMPSPADTALEREYLVDERDIVDAVQVMMAQ